MNGTERSNKHPRDGKLVMHRTARETKKMQNKYFGLLVASGITKHAYQTIKIFLHQATIAVRNSWGQIIKSFMLITFVRLYSTDTSYACKYICFTCTDISLPISYAFK